MSDLGSTSGQAAPNMRLGINPNVLMPVLWLAAAVAIAWPSINGGVFDAMAADDAMRLVQVRDLIGGQGWFDLFQHRLDPPGASMHWSRVVDLPLAALILLLRPLLGMHGAEAVTLFLYPLLLLAAALALVAGIARHMSGNTANAPITAVVLAVLSAPALIHFRPGAIDHHNAQIVLLLAVVLLTSQIEQSAIKGALGGVAASLSLAIGIEMLPAIAATGLAVFGLLVWRGASVSRQVCAFRRGTGGIIAAAGAGIASTAVADVAGLRRLRRAGAAAARRRRHQPGDHGRNRSLSIRRCVAPGYRSGVGDRSGWRVLLAVCGMHDVALRPSRSARDIALGR